MSLLSITRSLVSFTNPTEAQFDSMRTALLAYFNAASMTQANIAPGSLLFTQLALAVDDASLKFTGNVAFFKYISADTNFQIESTGAIVFLNKMSTSTAESLRFATSGTTTLGTGGLLKINQAVGSQAVTTNWIMSMYRKPRLEYTDGNIVTVAENGPNSGESLVMMRDRLCTIVDRTLSLAVNANGETVGDTGAAVSGLGAGLARTANRWYYVYAVRVQYGDDLGGVKAILVANLTSPVQANCGTLDTAFGAGEWVYMGVIRNGWNDGVSTNVIVPFTYDGYGGLHFTTAAEAGLGYGMTLASSSSTSDLAYDIAFGVSTAEIPVVATRGVIMGYRSEDGFQIDYVNIASGEIQAQGTCNADTDTTSTVVAAVQLHVPFISGYRVVVRVGSDSSTNRIKLASLVDHYV